MLARLGARFTSGPARTSLAVSLIFATTSAVIGVHMPYLPLWFDWAGLSAYEIALLGSVPVFLRIVTYPVAGFLADRWGRPAQMVLVLSWAAVAGYAALTQMRGFGFILLAVLYLACTWGPVFPLSETVAMGVIRRTGLDYGRMRLWGSVAFIVTNLAGGWAVERVGSDAVVWLIGGLVLLSALAAHVLLAAVREEGATRGPAHPATGPRLSLAGVASLARRRDFLLFLAATGAVQSAHAMLYTFGTLHWRANGLSAEWAGALWTVSIVMEVALFAMSGSVLKWLRPVQLIMLGCAAAVVRWIAMGFDPGLVALVPLQMSHALTFGASHIGAIHFMSRVVPERQMGTAQALYAAFTGGLAMGAATLCIGPLYANFAGRAYWAMALIALAGLGASALIARGGRLHGQAFEV